MLYFSFNFTLLHISEKKTFIKLNSQTMSISHVSDSNNKQPNLLLKRKKRKKKRRVIEMKYGRFHSNVDIQMITGSQAITKILESKIFLTLVKYKTLNDGYLGPCHKIMIGLFFKIGSSFQPFAVFTKELHHRCSTGSEIFQFA